MAIFRCRPRRRGIGQAKAAPCAGHSSAPSEACANAARPRPSLQKDRPRACCPGGGACVPAGRAHCEGTSRRRAHAGGAYYLCREEGLLFTGDNICREVWLFLPGACPLEQWVQRAEKTLCLVGQNGLRMYSGHGGAVAPAMVYGQISTARKYLGRTRPTRIWPVCARLRAGAGKNTAAHRTGCMPRPPNRKKTFSLCFLVKICPACAIMRKRPALLFSVSDKTTNFEKMKKFRWNRVVL